MPTEVSPTDVKREEYGFMLGQRLGARRLRGQPTPTCMSRMRNEAVTKKLIGPGHRSSRSAPTLKPKPTTPSGFAWSTSDGPALQDRRRHARLDRIVVDRKAPITMVMPFLRKTFGVA